LCLRLSEPGARARRELLDQARLAEPAHLHVALGRIDGLGVPVGVLRTNGVFRLGLAEPGARLSRLAYRAFAPELVPGRLGGRCAGYSLAGSGA
jgi:hypothetical protein